MSRNKTEVKKRSKTGVKKRSKTGVKKRSKTGVKNGLRLRLKNGQHHLSNSSTNFSLYYLLCKSKGFKVQDIFNHRGIVNKYIPSL